MKFGGIVNPGTEEVTVEIRFPAESGRRRRRVVLAKEADGWKILEGV